MNSLDSRFLRPGDTFTQSFSQLGRYGYDFVLPVPHRFKQGDTTFAINVKDGDMRREGVQHNILVRQEGGKLKAVPPEQNIMTGDVVTWYALDPSIPGFSVVGHSETDSFSSAAMTYEALYTHAFGSPGVIEWECANGHNLKGRVIVKKAKARSAQEIASYKERLAEGTLVLISGDRVEPVEVEIVEGQTVCFAVEKAEGITITDRRLLVEIPVACSALHAPA